MAAIFALLPLFAGLFAVTAKPAPLHLDQYLGRYIAFILLFVSWALFRYFAIKLIDAGKLSTAARYGAILGVATLAVLCIATNFLFKARFEDIAYQIALIAVGFGALWSRYLYLKRYQLATLWGVLADTLIGFLSFQIVLFEWQWQPLIFSIPFACASVLAQLSAIEGKDPHEIPIQIKKILFALMPVSIGFMVVAGAMPAAYIVLLTILFAEKFVFYPPSYTHTKVILTMSVFFIVLGALTFIVG